MKKFWNITAFVLLLAVLVTWLLPGSAQAKESFRTLEEIQSSGTVNIGVFSDKSPFGFVDENGDYQGYDVYFANRIGEEQVIPGRENQNQSSSLTFYGSSFIADATGAIVSEAGREEETIVLASFDREELRRQRLSWGLFRDRRPELYGPILTHGTD